LIVLFSVQVNSSYFLYQIELQPPWNLRKQLFICDRFNLKADHAATGFAELGGAVVLVSVAPVFDLLQGAARSSQRAAAWQKFNVWLLFMLKSVPLGTLPFDS